MQNKTWDRILMVLRWLIAAIFIYAGVGKILAPATFAENIDNYRLLPYFLVTLMAIILPWLELICGILLIGGRFKTSAAFLTLIMSIMFLIAIGSAVVRGLDITCGCFAVDNAGTKIGITRLVEDVLLFGAIVVVYIRLIKTTPENPILA